MIDFQQGFVKLAPINPEQIMPLLSPMIVDNESIVAAFRTVRDSVVFTDKRIIAINVQGITGKKTAYTSLPYSKVQAFSIETAGVLDRDCEIELYFSALGKVKFEIKGNFNIVHFNKILSQYVL
ncbi:PH domain-containing protein [Ktedonobacter robiniae]|uniref:Bacterial Pleckstrin homology domain-containing protein n=1 Tax=Ktedonobacter robiniae TaxID=2778365 RepID=A0ABQ3UY92_9CHLR|nr:PH domain-containing protein [Ktedonobacter robiniae]GHO57748.1 hypothetical protein KSB_62230 [Ktedonobacter robiniae]